MILKKVVYTHVACYLKTVKNWLIALILFVELKLIYDDLVIIGVGDYRVPPL